MKLKARPLQYPPVTIELTLTGDLKNDLDAYAAHFEKEHHQNIEMQELIVSILAAFVSSDRDFQKARRKNSSPNGRGKTDKKPSDPEPSGAES